MEIPPSGQTDSVVSSKLTARIHFDGMASYLVDYFVSEPANLRSSAREKLTRLTRAQFQELSTDVYDELMRRKNTENSGDHPAVPFLPIRDEFHPKRNQARGKLATLREIRFKDLSSDVHYELGRRFPEFREVKNPGYNTGDPEPLVHPQAQGYDYVA